MNSHILRVAFLLSAMTLVHASDSEAITFFIEHPQEQFCSADFGKFSEHIWSFVLI